MSAGSIEDFRPSTPPDIVHYVAADAEDHALRIVLCCVMVDELVCYGSYYGYGGSGVHIDGFFKFVPGGIFDPDEFFICHNSSDDIYYFEEGLQKQGPFKMQAPDRFYNEAVGFARGHWISVEELDEDAFRIDPDRIPEMHKYRGELISWQGDVDPAVVTALAAYAGLNDEALDFVKPTRRRR